MIEGIKKWSDKPFLPQTLFLLFSFLVIFSRRPDAILYPQFWAEDGRYWYADAYNHGWLSLFFSQDGYFQTVSRLVGIASQILPFGWSPLFFVLVAVSAKILIALLLISRRFSNVLPEKLPRYLIAFIFLAIPNSYEVHANLTNLQWHLALLTLLLIIAEPAKNRAWKIFDYLVVSVTAVSGVFSVMLFPIAFLHFYFKREKQSLRFGLILLIGAFSQVFAFFAMSPAARESSVGLGATAALFSKIIAGQFFIASLIGQRGFAALVFSSFWKDGFAVLIMIAGFSFLGFIFLKSKLELRLLMLFSAMQITAALLSPMATLERPQWQVLWLPGIGCRYWFIPTTCLLIIYVSTAFYQENRWLKFLAAAALLILPLGIRLDWTYPAWNNLEFQTSVEKFDAAQSGEAVEIPIQPEGWKMKLTKK